jgi:hypothetical protein
MPELAVIFAVHRHVVMMRFVAALALVLLGRPLAAQDTASVRRDTVRADTTTADSAAAAAVTADTTAGDTTAAATTIPDSLGILRVSPGAALWRSLLLPGWGQLKLGRKLTAAVFVVGEGVTLGMSLKTNHDLRHLQSIGADTATIRKKSQQREDWFVFLAVNHLLAGIEAYVAANLSDFPAELHIRRRPGGIDAGLAVPLRLP